MARVVVVPIRDFSGMTRLSDVLDSEARTALATRLATRAVETAGTCGLRVVVVSADGAVSDWASGLGVETCDDPGGGLSAAAAAGVSCAHGAPWLVLHADLPLITRGSLEHVVEAGRTSTVIVPSQDGGTTVLAGLGAFPFSYGVGSFQRHYASAPDATVIISPELGIDIDTARDLAAFPHMR